MVETSESQIPGSSSSLSITSEPPDLGNWFGSYRYESPAMDSNYLGNEFDAGKSERGKDEGSSCGFEEIGDEVGVFVHKKKKKKKNSDEVVRSGSSSGDQCFSKISGSSESPSLLSEPTNIKNWFSSYVYESPSLDTTDGFGGFLRKQSTCEKDVFLIENSKRENEEELGNLSTKRSVGKGVVGEEEQPGGLQNFDSSWRVTKEVREPVREAPGPLGSPSILSELVHIKNWFSSYVTESPSLDSYDNFGDSVGKESKCEKDGFIVENRKRDNKENMGDFGNSSVGDEGVDDKKQTVGLAKCDSSRRDAMHDRQPVYEVPGPFDTSSHLSEPTDIRNWFSSYVYESSSLDTANGFGDFVCRDRIDEKGEVLVETNNRKKRDVLEGFSKKETYSEAVDIEKVQSEEQIRRPVHSTNAVDENLYSDNELCFKYTLKIEQNHYHSQAKLVGTSSFNKGDSQCKLDQEILHGTRFRSLNNQRVLCSNDGKCPQNLIYSRGSTLQESSESKIHAEDYSLLKSSSELISVNGGASLSKSTHGSKASKDDGRGISEDGFITTRKRKFTAKTDENSSKRPAEINEGKEVVIERKALTDTTNFHHSPATMITGKWKCPQQRKPNLGPPLKQLGLEHWIRKS